MNQPRSPRKLLRGERFYAMCLRLYPRAHRRAYGSLMLQTFRDSYRDAMKTQGRTGMPFWFGVIADETQSLLREHGTALRDDVLRMTQWRQWRIEIATGVFLLGAMVVYIARCVA